MQPYFRGKTTSVLSFAIDRQTDRQLVELGLQTVRFITYRSDDEDFYLGLTSVTAQTMAIWTRLPGGKSGTGG